MPNEELKRALNDFNDFVNHGYAKDWLPSSGSISIAINTMNAEVERTRTHCHVCDGGRINTFYSSYCSVCGQKMKRGDE